MVVPFSVVMEENPRDPPHFGVRLISTHTCKVRIEKFHVTAIDQNGLRSNRQRKEKNIGFTTCCPALSYGCRFLLNLRKKICVVFLLVSCKITQRKALVCLANSP